MFKYNIKALRLTNPKLADKLEKISLKDASVDITVQNAQTQDLIILYKNLPLDNVENPIAGAKTLWNDIIKSEPLKNDIILVFGLGLGYLFKRAAISCESGIILYEPVTNILRFVFEYVDFTEQLIDKRIYFTDSIDDCCDFISKKYLSGDNIEVVYNPVYSAIAKENFIELTSQIIDVCESKLADINTALVSGKSRTINTLENIKYLENTRPVNMCKDIFRGKTALILAAGPSLKDNIAEIIKNRDKFVVFAVNKVFDYLVNNGIKPDFTIFLDPAYLSYTINSAHDVFADINIIAGIRADNYAFTLPHRKFLTFFSNNDAFSNYLHEQHPDSVKGYETTGSSVSTAFFSAKEMGFSNIIFSGLDMGFKDNVVYADETKLEKNTPDTAVFRGTSKNLMKIKSVTGKEILTREDYALFVKQLSEVFKKEKSVNIYNTSDFGALIKGMKYANLSDIIKNISSRGCSVDEQLDNVFDKTAQNWQDVRKTIDTCLQEERVSLSELKKSIENWIITYANVIQGIDIEDIQGIITNPAELKELLNSDIEFVKAAANDIFISQYLEYELMEYVNSNSASAFSSFNEVMTRARLSFELFGKVMSAIDEVLALLS